MNSMQLKDKIRYYSSKKDVDFNTLLRLYMYDRFIERLAKSKYKENLIIKGGFYISLLLGVEQRNTRDIDVCFQNINFDKENIILIIKDIISIDINDNVKLEYIGISEIRDEDEYGGFRIELQANLESIRERFHIDVATGDPITPKEIMYKYKPFLNDYYIDVFAYTIETVIAEKLETILKRVEVNSRMRDYYDLFLIYNKEWGNIDINNLKEAVRRTFAKRDYFGNPIEVMNIIENSDTLKVRWKRYTENYKYAEDLEYDDVIKCINNIIKYIV